MTFLDPTRAELSRHEAGHAYAYAALNRGDEPEELGLAKAENGWRGWCLRRTMLHREVGAISDQASNVRPYLVWQAAAEIVVALAGPLAEVRHRERDPAAALLEMEVNAEAFLTPGCGDRDGDFEHIRATMSFLDPDDQPAVFRQLLDVADECLTGNWIRIERLAERLRARGVLSNDALYSFFVRHPAFRTSLDAVVAHIAANLRQRSPTSRAN